MLRGKFKVAEKYKYLKIVLGHNTWLQIAELQVCAVFGMLLEYANVNVIQKDYSEPQCLPFWKCKYFHSHSNEYYEILPGRKLSEYHYNFKLKTMSF